LPKGKAECD